MALPLFDHWHAIEDRLRSAPRLWVGLDFDGTLVELQDDPFAVVLAEPHRPLLADLSTIHRTAIISGRSLADLRSRIGIKGMTLVGNHGLEWEDNRHASASLRIRRELETHLEILLPQLDQFPGIFLEDKGLTLEIHARKAPQHVGEIFRLVDRCLDRSSGLMSRRDVFGIQVLPREAGSKGTAARSLAGGDFAIFIGDSLTDEDAFVALAGQLTVCVGSHPTAAAYRVTGPKDVHELLRRIVNFRHNRATKV